MRKIDYSNKENWVLFDENPKFDVDTIYLYPTVMQGDGADQIAIANEAMKKAAFGMYKIQGSVFESFTNIYVPLYDEITASYVTAIIEGGGFFDETVEAIHSCGAPEQIYDALDYYFENANNGRPFILASHSQGSTLSMKVLDTYMKNHPEYFARMIASYSVGTCFTPEWRKNNPHIKFAQGETDTGVVISWNTEGPDATAPSACALKDAYVINPLTWTTEETYAPVELNLGSLEVDMKTRSASIVKGKADAQVYHERGVVICTTVAEYFAMPGFGDKCMHGGDYGLFYENIKENAQKRINAFLNR